DIANYIKAGVLWEAFESPTPAVVLIDEIDKADIEFPNDLLRELDRMEFYVYETRRTIVARHRPLVVITSNNEKELPDAFLRRCFFHYIKFPDRDTMTRIVDVHFPGLKKALLQEALEVFFNLREVPGLKKKPSTSELLDWLKLLLAEDIPPEALKSADRKAFIPPLHGALLDTALDMRERLGAMPFAVRDNASGDIVGSTRYFNVDADNRRLEIGHTWYARRAQRTPINTECKLMLLTHAFETLRCIAVEF